MLNSPPCFLGDGDSQRDEQVLPAGYERCLLCFVHGLADFVCCRSDYDPKKGSLNSQLGQHPLRERARKLKSEGILVIRFEMPFNVWCLHCNAHIGKGVRYNAEKKQVLTLSSD